jgi:glycosyltransferase involved in cell wall biosynthesis
MVIHDQTGFLADTPDEWAEAAHRLASQPELRAKLGAAGRKLVEDRYNTADWGSRFASLLGGLAAGLPPMLSKTG